MRTPRSRFTPGPISSLASRAGHPREQALVGEILIREQPCDARAAEEALHRRETLACLTDRAGRCLTLGGAADIVGQAAGLRRLFAAYAAQSTITRDAARQWRQRLHEGDASLAVNNGAS